MIDYIQFYLGVGIIWSLLHTVIIGKDKITTGYQVRLLMFWPVTMVAWIIGFIEAMVQTFNNPYDRD